MIDMLARWCSWRVGERMDLHETVVTPATMADRVTSDAQRHFGHLAESAVLEQCAQAAVADLWQDSIKVTRFVPLLALRQVKEMLEARLLAHHR